MLIGIGGTLSAWVPAVAAVFGLLLAADRLGNWLLAVAAGVLLLWGGTGALPEAMLVEVGALSWTVGIAAGIGCVVHTLGDMITRSGGLLHSSD